MRVPLQITFRDVPASEAARALVQKKTRDLTRFSDAVTSCRVVVEAPHRHQQKGHIYRVRIELTVPGAELVADRSPDQHAAHEDLYVAIRDAFRAARRELKEYNRRRRGDVKRHSAPAEPPVMPNLVAS